MRVRVRVRVRASTSFTSGTTCIGVGGGTPGLGGAKGLLVYSASTSV